MELKDIQSAIRKTYIEKDKKRGVYGTFLWFVEEVGELAEAILKSDRSNLELEFSDTLAWLISLANLLGIDLDSAMERYTNGCPKCQTSPCSCTE